MSDTEAQEVIKLLEERRQSREHVMSQPSISDVAQLANASEYEVAEALRDVRAHSAPTNVVPATDARSNRTFLLLFVALLVITSGVIQAFRMSRTQPTPDVVAAETQPVAPVADKVAEAGAPVLADTTPTAPAESRG